jgi:hypothetical protein
VSGNERCARGEKGPLPVKDTGVTIHDIKRWREVEYDAGRPSGLDDFYLSRNLCPKCRGEGVCMIGWSEPSGEDEMKAAEALNWKEFPLYAACARCGGTGKSVLHQ